MKLTAYSYTNQGGRDHNEDSVRCLTEAGVFVLADGLGGHQCGEVASGLAADVIAAGCAEAAPTPASLLELFQKANEAILDAQKTPGREDMKTTAVALSIQNEKAIWAHIGDSRLYHFSDGAVTPLTRDHSVTYRKYLGGEITYMDICHDDDRSSLLRVLGKSPCVPETAEKTVKAGDAFLLCSDGFWEYIYDQEMLADRLKAEMPEQWAQLMLLRHIRRTPPGNDNFSLITVFVEDDL